jgi:antitoxin (DNA-binding transcriptional repressor) of toxin-antitoxin stability system
MRVVGIQALKAILSAYLREVRRGEVFLVTDRDEVVAELRPAGPHAPAGPQDDIARTLEALAATGDVAQVRMSGSDWSWRPRGAGLPEGTAGALVDEQRGDR